MQLVVERLTGPVVHAHPDTPLGVCARLMLHNGFRHLPIVDDATRPVGMVEDLEVFRRGALLGPELDLWLAFEPEYDRLRALDVMSPFGGRCAPGSSLLTALVQMGRSGGDALAVVDDEEGLVGLITEHDAVEAARDLVDPERTVASIATTDPITADWLQPGADALSRMFDAGVRHILVTREGLLHGVVSLRDLVSENVTQRTDLVLHDVMRAGPVHTTRMDASIREAAGLMVREKIGCLPICQDDARPRGLVTRADFRRAAVQALEKAHTPMPSETAR